MTVTKRNVKRNNACNNVIRSERESKDTRKERSLVFNKEDSANLEYT